MKTKEARQDVLKKLFLSLWAMATLILFFCVVLLIREMLDSGQVPLQSLRRATTTETQEANAGQPGGTTFAPRETQLYFANEDGRGLSGERRDVPYGENTIENCRKALEALIEGPHEAHAPIVPEKTKIRALYLLPGGELIVDLSRELRLGFAQYNSVSSEALMVYGIVHTLTQPSLRGEDLKEVHSIRFLFEGAMPDLDFPGHIDLQDPVGPDIRWVAGQEAAVDTL